MELPFPAFYGFALLSALLWGFSPILSKRGMAAGGSALQASLVVVTVDSAVYWLGLLWRHGASPFAGLPPEAIGLFLLAGLVGTALGRLATFAGVHRVGASVNSAAISTRPLFATALALAWLGEPVSALTAVGILVLVAGLVVLALGKGGDLGGWGPRDLLFPLAAAGAFAVGNVVRRYGLNVTDASTLQGVALNETAAFVALFGFAVATRRVDVLRAPRETYAFFVGSGLLTAVALFSVFEGFDRGPVALVDSIAAVAPFFTTIFAYFLLSDVERVTKGVAAGALLVVCGAALITLV